MAVEAPGMSGEPPEPIPPAPLEPPPMHLPAPAPPPAAAAGPETAPRRARRNVLWYAAVGVAIVVTLGAFGLLYNDDQNWQRQAAQLRDQNRSLSDELSTTKADEASAQQQAKALQSELQHPQLGLWNVPQTIDGPSGWLEGGIPDTFTYHLRATSTGPMAVMIMTFSQYATAYDCANNGPQTSYQCFTSGAAEQKFIDVTSVNYDFHLAEGCAGYLAVWTARSSITVQPDVSVTYNPARSLTGVCVP